MASTLLALLDDITTVLDDVALLTKVAAKKSAGVLGDDLALNAEQVSGVQANRELPVVWAVAKGSLKNKAILVPAALAISAVTPWLVTPLLMLGGLYLCFEGFEKLVHKFLHRREEEKRKTEISQALLNPEVDMVALERDKIKGAIRTDFILSAEIIVIALGSATGRPFVTQFGVLAGIALLMTAGVYGLVGAIVKLDDLGLMLSKSRGVAAAAGRGILAAAPLLMKTLGIAGAAAMFLVGGGILTHGIAPLHHGIEHSVEVVSHLPHVGSILGGLAGMALNGLAGVAAGGLATALVFLIFHRKEAA
jgi:predicted DNA repair protein MutK